MTRLLIVSQWFDPEPTTKGSAFAQACAARGFDVEVLTGFPNYPDGRVYPGFRLRPYRRDTHGAVTVHRTWLFPSHSRSVVGRAANYLSFAASAATLGFARVRRPDVIYAYHPPATAGIVGALAARLFGAPLVLDVQDLWPESVLSSGMVRDGIAMRMLRSLCRWEYRSADRVVALSQGMATLLEERGVPSSRLQVIHNWADESRMMSCPDESVSAKARADFGERFSILFAGQMGEAQGLDSALAAAAQTPEIDWVFMGGGTERGRLEGLAQAKALANVRFLPPVPVAQVGAWLAAASALLVHLSDDPLYEASIPSKTQAYMLAGRPILMVARGDAAALVSRADAGVVCAPGDPSALAGAARQLASMSDEERRQCGARGRAHYDQELDFSAGVDRFASIFREVSCR
jgi:colanic acid biosynthesis glycosyl transferase WcaI